MKWIEMTSAQLHEARERASGVAVIPIGSIEAHGPHLPLGCDTRTIEVLLERVIAVEPVVVLPTMVYTFLPQSTHQPGSINIKSSLLLEFLTAVLDEVYRNGFEKIVLLHGHGGNIPMHETILQHVIEEGKPYALYSIPCWVGVRLGDPPAAPIVDHAGDLETSIAMALFGDRVRMDLLGDERFPARRELDAGVARTPVDWISHCPLCCVGEPRDASAEKGEELARMWMDALVEALRKIKADRVVPQWMARSRRHGP